MNLPALILTLCCLTLGFVYGYAVGHHDATQAARVQAGNRAAGGVKGRT